MYKFFLKKIVISFLLLFFWTGAVSAREVILRDIILTTSKTNLLAYFTIDGCFTKNMQEAIFNGVPVTFTFIVKLNKKRTLFPDKRINSFKIYHTIKYDQLKDVFEIKRTERSEGVLTLKDFVQAKHIMGEVETKVTPLFRLKKGEKYQLSLKAELNKVTLPLYLHYIFFFVSLWNFETNWYNIVFAY